jgi:hypothetical protein
MNTDSISPANKLPYIRTLWASALVVSLLLSVFAAFCGGYVGPDYDRHLPRLAAPGVNTASARVSVIPRAIR